MLQEYDIPFCIIFLLQQLSEHYFSKNQKTNHYSIRSNSSKVSNGQSTRSLKEEIKEKEKIKYLIWSLVT